MYRYDLHVHTSEVSFCGVLPAKEMVRRYHEAGYTGFVMTDHFNRPSAVRYGLDTVEERIAHYLSGYRIAREYGKELGLTVLCGAELQVVGNEPNEYLLYGLTEEFLLAHPELYLLDLMQLRQVATENGILIFQAHPYRPGMVRAMPGFLDGVEVYNGNPRHNSRNDMALQYAVDHDLLQSSGSDAHQQEDVGIGGIECDVRIETEKQLADLLRAGAYRLIRNPMG